MMEEQTVLREVFRRSWLTLIPEWSLAVSVALAVTWAAHRFGLQAGEEWLYSAMLPIIWTMGRTFLWVYSTWTVTADGRLIVQQGPLPGHRQEIALGAVRRFEPTAPARVRWLNVGHITFWAGDSQGRIYPFHWTWLERHSRLCELIRARGQLPVGRPTWRQLVGRALRRLIQRLSLWLMQGHILSEEILARLAGRWCVEDYGRFMAFCQWLLRSAHRRRDYPPWVSRAVIRRWMAVLRQARIVVDSHDGGWRMAMNLHTLEDIRRRIGPDQFLRAVRRPVGPELCWLWARR